MLIVSPRKTIILEYEPLVKLEKSKGKSGGGWGSSNFNPLELFKTQNGGSWGSANNHPKED